MPCARAVRRCLLAMVVLLAAGYSLAAAPVGGAADEAAVRSIVTSMATAWNKRDVPGFCHLFADRMDFVTRTGVWIRNRRELEARLKTLFAGEYTGTTLQLKPHSIQFLKSDIAVAQVEGEVARPNGAPVRTMTTLVLVKQKGYWKIAAAESTEIRETAPNESNHKPSDSK